MAEIAVKPRIVVVGAGFGGLAAVKGLKRAEAEIILIDRYNHHLFQPLLYQVATAALSPADIATATRALLHRQPNVSVLLAEVANVDAAAKCVRLADGRDIAYDYLVLATGAAYSFFGRDDFAQHAQVLKTLGDALSIRHRLLSCFELAEQSDDPAEIARLLTFVVVGAGPTGVEMAGTIAELARSSLASDFRRIDPRSARVVLCEAGPRVLSSYPEALSAYALGALEELGVEVRLGRAVEEISPAGLVIGGEALASANVVWCAGTQARPAAQWLGAAAARNGSVVVEPDCSLAGHPEIFAIGDVASCTDPSTGRPLPGLAPVAKQQGQYVARLLAAKLVGAPAPGPFRYRNLGTMAVIGRSHAVADFGWLRCTGYLAWLAWSLVHLMLLVDFRSRLSVYVNWSWAWFTYGRGARLLTAPVGSQPFAGEQAGEAAGREGAS